MKLNSILAAFVLMILAVSCKKDYQSSPYGGNDGSQSLRKVRYVLYTNENYSTDEHNITFSLHMSDGQSVILDSALATMKVKDIPDFDHRIIIEKSVPGNNQSTLAVSFIYEIENVGVSWFLEPFPAGDTLKVLDYSFR